MRRFDCRKIAGILVPAALALVILVPACRREPEPLDRNRAPKTFLTVAPPETSNAEYRVHMFWHGEDQDGVVERFIWYRSDTLRTLRPDLDPQMELLDWNPAMRRADYIKGTLTTRTDTVLIFTGFDAASGAKLKRQAFHIAAIDDGGKIDPNPARIQFFAEVKCVPEVEFWYESETIPRKRYRAAALDTISMFEPFQIGFIGTTCNNYITGYQWNYRGRTYPDYDGDGRPDWYIPTTAPPETVEVMIPNRDALALPSGVFNFRAVARDEAGALSEADLASGEGVFRLVVNRDPDTKILFGENIFFRRDGVRDSTTINFSRTRPDTLPYNSLLRVHYAGWDDPRDSLQDTNPPLPIRFQFKFERWGAGLSGGSASYRPGWLPDVRAENTNCAADEDSTTFRIGSYDYLFLAKAFDEQYRADGTPDTIAFVGNFKPTITMIAVAFDSTPFLPAPRLRRIDTDTLYIAINQQSLMPRGDTLIAFNANDPAYYNPDTERYRLEYRFFILGEGHDDPRDPPGSAIRGWWWNIDAEQDRYWRGENEFLMDFEPNTLRQEMRFSLDVPRDPDSSIDDPRPDPNFIANQPLWMGRQDLTVLATDIHVTSRFREEIRGISPSFVGDDPCNARLEDGRWIGLERRDANYGRTDTYTGRFHIKLVY